MKIHREVEIELNRSEDATFLLVPWLKTMMNLKISWMNATAEPKLLRKGLEDQRKYTQLNQEDQENSTICVAWLAPVKIKCL